MYLSLRTKLVATLLFVSLIVVLSVGGIAYLTLMKDFNATVHDQAFEHFQADVQAYFGKFGSWENAQRNVSFPDFVAQRAEANGNGVMRAHAELASKRGIPFHPPFHFLLTDPQGRVLLATGGYQLGQTVEDAVLRQAKPISDNGRIAAFAVPVGTPQLSAEDRASLGAMRKALRDGMFVAIAVAIVLGLLLGSRFGARVREVTVAIRSMRADGGLRHPLPVRSRDEMGELVEAFNRMSDELVQAHANLKATTAQVQLQSDQLKELSIRDPLTQLFNRRYFDEHAALLYQQATRGGRPMCVVVADLDFFKDINDSFSHAVGDAVLRRIADLMRQNIRRSDVVARYGGEEFVIALPDCTETQAAACCEKLRLSIEQYPWSEVHDGLRVTLSIGLCGNLEAGGVEKMLAVADSALYEAKRSGRNRTICGSQL